MKAKEVAMTIALAVLGALFVGLLVDAIYESPKYEDYCGRGQYEAQPYPKYVVPGQEPICGYNATKTEIDAINKCYEEEGMPEFNYDDRNCQTSFKECNFCNKQYQDATEVYNRNVFYIVAPIGALAVIIGLFIGYEVVGTGFMFSGILLVAYATMRYFSNMSKIMRVVVIFIELVLLVLISIKKLKK
ncbi:MAG: hypothetical protein AABX72_04565 [Nanoarchaeota archaeon]